MEHLYDLTERKTHMKFALINVYYQFGSTGKGVKKNYNRIKKLGHEVKVFYGASRQDVHFKPLPMMSAYIG